AADGLDGTGSVSVGTGYTDLAGNAGTAGTGTVAISTNNPTLVVDIVAASLSDGDNRTTVTFTFSEDVTGFGIDDLAAVGGALSDFQAVDAQTFTATFTAADGFEGTGSVSVAAGSYTDAAGNPGAAGSDTVAIDTRNPTLVGVAVNADGS